jgi:hypothetical protein
MAEYKIIRLSDGYGVEVRAPGSFLSTSGFATEAIAAEWVAEQKLRDCEAVKRVVC